MTTRFIRDSIHSFVSFEKKGLINQIIDTAEFQRMRDIRQLGFSYFTYPSAHHSRFSHSLGTYWLAKRVGNLLLNNADDKRDLEIAALLHDIGHGPFSHALEKMIMPSIKHEVIACNLISDTASPINKKLVEYGIDPDRIVKIISKVIKPKYLYSIISSQLDVDRFDYLLRDTLMSGNPHGGFDIERIIQTIRIGDNHEIYVSKGGWDAVEHYLNCRYQMYKQVYFHHSTLAAEELSKKILTRLRDLYNAGSLEIETRYKALLSSTVDLKNFLQLTDTDILNLIKICKNFNDPILLDLQKRFEERKLFKSITLPGEKATIAFENEKKIITVLNQKGYNERYYFSYVSLDSKEAYTPYKPDSKDPEDYIFIDKECKKEITCEIESLKAITSKSQFKIFMPGDCKDDIEKILSVI